MHRPFASAHLLTSDIPPRLCSFTTDHALEETRQQIWSRSDRRLEWLTLGRNAMPTRVFDIQVSKNFLGLVGAALLYAAGSIAASAQPTERKVIIFVWDGLRPDVITPED